MKRPAGRCDHARAHAAVIRPSTRSVSVTEHPRRLGPGPGAGLALREQTGKQRPAAQREGAPQPGPRGPSRPLPGPPGAMQRGDA